MRATDKRLVTFSPRGKHIKVRAFRGLMVVNRVGGASRIDRAMPDGAKEVVQQCRIGLGLIDAGQMP